MVQVIINIILAPTLSIMIPPIKGTITLGKAYREYKRLNYVYCNTTELAIS